MTRRNLEDLGNLSMLELFRQREILPEGRSNADEIALIQGEEYVLKPLPPRVSVGRSLINCGNSTGYLVLPWQEYDRLSVH